MSPDDKDSGFLHNTVPCLQTSTREQVSETLLHVSGLGQGGRLLHVPENTGDISDQLLDRLPVLLTHCLQLLHNNNKEISDFFLNIIFKTRKRNENERIEKGKARGKLKKKEKDEEVFPRSLEQYTSLVLSESF